MASGLRGAFDKMPVSGVYGGIADEISELFADYLYANGKFCAGGDCLTLVISTAPLSDVGRNAILKSLDALGIGSDSCTFATLQCAKETVPFAHSAMQDEPNSESEAARETICAKGTVPFAHSALPDLNAEALFLLVEGIDPLRVVCTDAQAAETLGEAYRTVFALDAHARVFGRTGAMFSNLEESLQTDRGKRLVWSTFKSWK